MAQIDERFGPTWGGFGFRIPIRPGVGNDTLEEYLEKREELKRVFMLIDFRHKPTEDDLLMYNFLKYYNLPVTVVATKADKVTGSKKEKNLKTILETLDLVVGDDLVVFSSVTKLGVKDVIKKIEGLVEETI